MFSVLIQTFFFKTFYYELCSYIVYHHYIHSFNFLAQEGSKGNTKWEGTNYNPELLTPAGCILGENPP